ncbi:MAG: hypothetical protein ACE5ES_04940, partial [Candidatus Nanoarchaeia archaeon]
MRKGNYGGKEVTGIPVDELGSIYRAVAVGSGKRPVVLANASAMDIFEKGNEDFPLFQMTGKIVELDGQKCYEVRVVSPLEYGLRGDFQTSLVSHIGENIRDLEAGARMGSSSSFIPTTVVGSDWFRRD